MSIRRIMLFTLGAKIKNLIEAFKTRVLTAQGEFEAETCLDAQLTDLDNKGLLDSASLIVTPNGYKGTRLYSVVPNNTTGDIIVTRATSATRVNSIGLVENVGINVPRIDYSNGSCPSILVEPQRTNLVFPSQILTTQTRNVTAVAHTLSFYGTGSVTLSGAAIGVLNGTGLNNRVALTFTPTAGSLTLTVIGSVTMAQLEVGSNATSYIPTVASTVTRNADVITNTNMSTLIGQTEGAMFVDFNYERVMSADQYFAILSDNSANNGIWITINPSNNFVVALRTLGSNTIFFVITAANFQLGRKKVLLSYKSGETNLYVNGVKIGSTNTSAFTFPVTINKFNLGSFWNSFVSTYTTINSAALWKTTLTDAQAIQLTTL